MCARDRGRRSRRQSRRRTTTQSGTCRPLARNSDLHHRLVHADRRREHAAADVGDVGQLEQALDRAVFAVRAVQHRKDDVEREARQRRGGFGLAVARRAAIDQHERVLARARRQEHFAAAAQRASRRSASDRSPRPPTPPTADGRPAPSGRPSRCGSRSVRSACDRGWRRRPPPTRATLRARLSGRRTARRHEDASRGQSDVAAVATEARELIIG